MADCLAIQCGVSATAADQYACALTGQSGVRDSNDPACAPYRKTMPTSNSSTQPLTIYSLTQPSPDIVAAANASTAAPATPSLFCEISQIIANHPTAFGIGLAVLAMVGLMPHGG